MPSRTESVLKDVSPAYPNTHFLFSFHPVPCSSFSPTPCLLCPGTQCSHFWEAGRSIAAWLWLPGYVCLSFSLMLGGLGQVTCLFYASFLS